MAKDSFEFIINLVDSNSQKDSSSSANSDEKKYQKEREKAFSQYRKDLLELEKLSEEEKLKAKRFADEEMKQQYKASLEEQARYASSLKERYEAAETLKRIEKEDRAFQEQAERLEKVKNNLVEGITSKFNSLFDKIRGLGEEYADYVERIEVGLIGSSKDYKSVTSRLESVFGMNVFFSMKDSLDKTAEFIEKGISYNVELRAGLAVMSDKIAKTFDAFDSNLMRLIKIQQQDSTQARLGMENILTYYLNENFQNSEYLANNLNSSVSSAILEAMASYNGSDRLEKSVEFEYAVQKWLGSFSSVGVSDSTIQALAQGLGYLGSGDVSALASNQALQQLMALSVSKSDSSKSYGDMLLSGLEAKDVSSIMTGFYNLVQEISDSNNLVALNQYAKIFNLSVSDITSMLNLNAQSVKTIAADMKGYTEMTQQVEDELSAGKLYSRTSASEMMKNVFSNINSTIGIDLAKNLGASMALEIANQAAEVMSMFEMGVEVDPFGVGASVKTTPSDLLKSTTAMVTYLAAFAQNIRALRSAISPNLSALGGESSNTIKLIGGSGTGLQTQGTTRNQAAYVGNTDQSNVYQTVSQMNQEATSEIITMDIDEEKKKVDRTMKAMEDIGNNVEFIVQLLNVDGIRVRYYPTWWNTNTGIATPDSSKKPVFGGNTLTQGGY